MSKKKKAFRAVAQLGKQSSLKLCATLEEAREFLAVKGSGVIEIRRYKMLMEYEPPLRLDDWQFVERVGSKCLIARPDASHGFWIESDYPLKSDWLPNSAFTTIYDNASIAVATAIEAVDDPVSMEVRVVDLSTGDVYWRSSEEEFE